MLKKTTYLKIKGERGHYFHRKTSLITSLLMVVRAAWHIQGTNKSSREREKGVEALVKVG